jgi:hypothetical protein
MFDETLWNEWSAKEEQNYRIVKGKPKYLKKGYLHFDNRFWFPDRKGELKKILRNNLFITHRTTGKKSYWAFSPFQRILVKTPRYRYQQEFQAYELETKIRPICFASHMDSLILGYYGFALNKKYESYIERAGFSKCVLAYRSNFGGKSNIQFSKEVFDYIKAKGNCTAVALDINGYFDHINHRILKESWQKVIGGPLPEDQYRIYKILTRYSYVNRFSFLKKYNQDFRKLKKEVEKAASNTLPQNLLECLLPGNKTHEKFKQLKQDGLIVTNDKTHKENGPYGIPQGSAISALLSNVYLIDFDKELCRKAQEVGFLYRRYCDDILVVCDTEKAEELKTFIVDLICKAFFLTIQDRKVDITDFFQNSKGQIRAFNRKKVKELHLSTITAIDEKYVCKPLQYLGFEFDGQNIRIRSSSLSRYFRKMKARLDKTVSMSYSPNAKSNHIFMRQIFERYTHLGKRNFLAYAYRAASKEYTSADGVVRPCMDSPAIRRQVRRHMLLLMRSLYVKNRLRYKLMVAKGKAPTLMSV